MEDLVNKIKKKLSVDNLVEMMKETKVIDGNRIREEDVRRTLEKTDIINNLIDVDELAARLNEVTEEAAANTAKVVDKPSTKPVTEKIMSGVINVFRKGESEKRDGNEDDSFIIEDNISGFFD